MFVKEPWFRKRSAALEFIIVCLVEATQRVFADVFVYLEGNPIMVGGSTRSGRSTPRLSHEINKNVNWIGKRFYVFYTFVILAGAFIVYFFFARPGIVTFYQGCTIVHVGHGLISFAMMHLFQGAPGELRDQGEYHDMSWWEQLEGGLPWTLHKKILMLVPLLLFLFVSHLTAYSGSHLLINASILALVMVPKLRAVHRHPDKSA